MRVLLIQPGPSPTAIAWHSLFVFEPLGLEYAAAFLGSHFDVRVLDLRLHTNLLRELLNFEPDIVGLTAYSMDVPVIQTILSDVAQMERRPLIVLGGPHADLYPWGLKGANIDVVVMGQNPRALCSIAECHSRKSSFSDVPGVGIIRQGRVDRTRPMVDSARLSWPAPRREFLMDVAHGYRMGPWSPIRTILSANHSANWLLDPDQVAEQIADAPQGHVVLLDQDFFADSDRSSALLQRLSDDHSRVRYHVRASAASIVANASSLKLWRRAGLESVLIEFQNDKPCSNERLAADALRAESIAVRGVFGVSSDFFPRDFSALARRARRLRISYPAFVVDTPFPDANAAAAPWALPGLYDNMHCVTRPRLPLAEFYQRYARVFLEAKSLWQKLALLRRQGVALRSRLLFVRKLLGMVDKIRHAADHHEWSTGVGTSSREVFATGVRSVLEVND